MRGLIALALVLVSTAAGAEEWVIVRKPTDPGQAGLPSILVDSASIVVLNNGIRRASVKIDFLADGRQHDASGLASLAFTIVVKSYDCGKRMLHEESTEFHNSDGSVHTIDSSNSPKWYPAPEIKAADPTLDFVCGWKSNRS
jgi:hypothetical protein